MQTLTFTYTKADGSSSERTLFALVTPSDRYAGIDMTMLEPNDAASFATRAERLHNDYVNSLRQLQEEYDMKHNYRQFLASGVSRINKI